MTKKEIGDLAEEIALSYEKIRLREGSDKRLQYVGDRHNLGFDIQSYDDNSYKKPRFIEVKSFSNTGFIFLTKQESLSLKALGDSAWIYVVDVNKRQIVRTIQNPIEKLLLENNELLYRIKI